MRRATERRVVLRHRTTFSGKTQDSSHCGTSGGYAFGDPSLQGGIRRCASTVGIRSARARPAPRPWHAPKKLCFGGKPRAKRSARRGRKAPRSCAPNAMPPFAPPCGHFASLVRSFATLIARVPSETLRVSTAHLASLESASLPPPADSFLHQHILHSPRHSLSTCRSIGLRQDMQSRERRRLACFEGRPE